MPARRLMKKAARQAISWTVDQVISTLTGHRKLQDGEDDEVVDAEDDEVEEEDDEVEEEGDDEVEEEDDEEVEEEEFDPTPRQYAVLIFIIITFLIIVTILFELFKDWLLESATKYTRPIYTQLFSEMTVLGFLSMVTFAISYGGTLNTLSTDIYGDKEGADEFILETLEVIHYLLFLVMVLTIAEVLMLVSIGSAAMKNFDVINLECQDEEVMKKKIKALDNHFDVSFWEWISDYCCDPLNAWSKHQNRIDLEETLIFYALRKEFIMKRSPMPPFEVADREKWLPLNFDYGAYQANCLSKFLVSIINFTPVTWLALWTISLVFFGILLLVNGYTIAMAAVWLFLGWLDMTLLYLVQQKCHYILTHLINPLHVKYEDAFPEDYAKEQAEKEAEKKKMENEETADETTPLRPDGPTGMLGAMKRPMRSGGSAGGHDEEEGRSSVSDDDSQGKRLPKGVKPRRPPIDLPVVKDVLPPIPAILGGASEEPVSVINRLRNAPTDQPQWTEIEPVEPGMLSRMVAGDAPPNRQHSLFWGDKIGPDLNVYLFRVHLIVAAIYFTVAVCFYIPYMFADWGIWQGVLYTVLTFIPIFVEIIGFYPVLIVQMSHIATTGLLRDPEIVDQIIRQQKAQKVIKLLILMQKLKHAGKHKGHGEHGHHEAPKKEWDMSDPKVKAEIDELMKTFDKFDSDGSGEIDKDEMGALMGSLGITLTETEKTNMFMALDTDGGGSVSKDELIDWWMSQKEEEEDEEELKGLAKSIFDMIDTDGGGSVTAGEFTEALEKMNAGLTPEEIFGIVRDFDEDGDGTISLEEFEKVIESAMR